MIRLFSIFICLFTNTIVSAAEYISGPILADVIRVRDGDSIDVVAKVWPGNEIRVSVRIRGIDAPELRARCSKEKRQAVAAREHLIYLLNGKPVHLLSISSGKYFGRVLANVTTANGMSIKENMLESGLVRPYRGKKRKSWCEDLAQSKS